MGMVLVQSSLIFPACNFFIISADQHFYPGLRECIVTLQVIPAVIPLIPYIMGLIMCPRVALVTDDSIMSNVCVGVCNVRLSFDISVFVP